MREIIVTHDTPNDADPIEAAVAYGDLSKLTSEQRNRRYLAVCKSLGLNPLTRPFEYLVLNGKLVEYCTRSGADQLRMIHNVSVEIVSRNLVGELLTVHTRAKTPDGRVDEDFGVISLPDHIKADIRANMVMKAITKAKRRVTLSICGLGWLDETEVEDIPAESKAAPPDRLGKAQPPGLQLAEAAERGSAALQDVWKTLSRADKENNKVALDTRHKPRAIEVDARLLDDDGDSPATSSSDGGAAAYPTGDSPPQSRPEGAAPPSLGEK